MWGVLMASISGFLLSKKEWILSSFSCLPRPQSTQKYVLLDSLNLYATMLPVLVFHVGLRV